MVISEKLVFSALSPELEQIDRADSHNMKDTHFHFVTLTLSECAFYLIVQDDCLSSSH